MDQELDRIAVGLDLSRRPGCGRSGRPFSISGTRMRSAVSASMSTLAESPGALSVSSIAGFARDPLACGDRPLADRRRRARSPRSSRDSALAAAIRVSRVLCIWEAPRRDLPQGVPVLLAPALAAQRQLSLRHDRRQRRPELVRELGGEQLLVAQARRKASEHVVEGGGELGELVVGLPDVESMLEVVLAPVGGLGGHLRDRAEARASPPAGWRSRPAAARRRRRAARPSRAFEAECSYGSSEMAETTVPARVAPCATGTANSRMSALGVLGVGLRPAGQRVRQPLDRGRTGRALDGVCCRCRPRPECPERHDRGSP